MGDELLWAVKNGDLSTIRQHIDKGADKSGKAPDGSSYASCAETDDIKALLK
jgi:hypothetical protein